MKSIRASRIEPGVLLVEADDVFKVRAVTNDAGTIYLQLQSHDNLKDYERSLDPDEFVTVEEVYTRRLEGPHGLEGTLIVELKSVANRNGRPTYYSTVLDKDGELLDFDEIHLGVGEKPSNDWAMASLTKFLLAACDAYVTETFMGRKSDNADIVDRRTAEWAYRASDELTMLSLEITGGIER